MIIDAHTHLGRPGHALNGRAADLVASMDAAGIDKALVLAGRINGISTQDVIEEIAPFKDRLYAIASVSPQIVGHHGDLDPTVYPEELEYLFKNNIIHGLKFYPGYEPFYPADRWLRGCLEVAQKYNRPAIFHSGDTVSTAHAARLKYALPLHIDDLAVDMPELKIILAHCSYPWQRECAEVVYKNKNVYADISGFVYGSFKDNEVDNFRLMIEEFIRISGSDEKLLFGTDWPIGDQKSYVDVAKKILPLSSGLMHKNAQELFGL